MREILFRGKQEYKNKEWVFGSLHSEYGETDKNGQRKIDYRILGMRGECDYVLSETVGQFTGLTDKNGNKIFEGDILSTENGTFSNTGMGHILFYKGIWTSFYGQDAIGRDCFDELHTVCNSREVIGNIHDNPELLRR